MDKTSLKQIKAHFISKLFLAIAFIYFVLTRIKYLDIPLDRDEGSYLYMGKMFLKGYVPYVDFYEIKPPGIFLIYGLYDLIFGLNNLTLHLGLVLVQLGMTFLVYKIIIELYKDHNKALVGSGILLLSLLIFNLLGFAILSEYFFIVCILLSVLLLLKSINQKFQKLLFWAGFFFGLSAMIRQHAVFYIIPFGFLLYERIKSEDLPFNKSLISFVVGGFSIVIPLLLYILIRGSFSEMILWVISKPNQSYVEAISWDEGIGYLFNFLKGTFYGNTSLIILFILGLVGTIILMINNKETRMKSIFVVLFFAFSFMSLFPGLRFYGHYWLMFLPAFAIVASNAYVYFKKIPHYIIPSFLTLAICYQIFETYEINLNTSPKLVYQFIYGDNPNPSLPKIIDFLKRRLDKKDDIYVFGSEPQVYYECNKILKSPHVYVGYLHIPGETNEQYQTETIRFLEKTSPKYILHIQNVNSINMKEGSSQHLYQWIYSHESRNYHPIAYVDIDKDNNPTYYFDKEAINHKPATNNYVILYEINN